MRFKSNRDKVSWQRGKLNHIAQHCPLYSRRAFWLACILGWVLGILAISPIDGQADVPGGWTTAYNLSNSPVASNTPFILADPYGGVHVFWAEDIVPDPAGTLDAVALDTIYYAYWDGTAWSGPVDILVSPDGGMAASPKAVVDSKGILHVIWGGNSGLYYSAAPTQAATSVWAWSKPTPVPSGDMPALGIAPDDSLVIVYVRDYIAIEMIRSTDGGQSWSKPQLIATPDREGVSVWAPAVAVDDQGIIHAAWAEYLLPDGWPPVDVFYARSTDGGLGWTPPQALAGDKQGQPTILAASGGTIHLVWSATAEMAGRYYRWSADRGQTWSETIRITSRFGFHPNDLMLDNAGVLHLVTSSGDLTQSSDVVVYTFWEGEHWAELTQVSDTGYSNTASATLSEGNLLHAVWVGEGLDGEGDIYYANRRTDAPYAAPRPFPAIVQQATSPLTPAATPTVTSRQPIITRTTGVASVPPPGQENSHLPSVAIGILTVAVLTAAVMLVRLTQRRGRG